MAKTKTIHKEKRNERERNRVHQVNIGFDRLRTTVQRISANKKMSKADTLREATRYIAQLKEILEKSGPIAYDFPMDKPVFTSENSCQSQSSPDYKMEYSQHHQIQYYIAHGGR